MNKRGRAGTGNGQGRSRRRRGLNGQRTAAEVASGCGGGGAASRRYKGTPPSTAAKGQRTSASAERRSQGPPSKSLLELKAKRSRKPEPKQKAKGSGAREGGKRGEGAKAKRRAGVAAWPLSRIADRRAPGAWSSKPPALYRAPRALGLSRVSGFGKSIYEPSPLGDRAGCLRDVRLNRVTGAAPTGLLGPAGLVGILGLSRSLPDRPGPWTPWGASVKTCQALFFHRTCQAPLLMRPARSRRSDEYILNIKRRIFQVLLVS
jgi:hypothetical protein